MSSQMQAGFRWRFAALTTVAFLLMPMIADAAFDRLTSWPSPSAATDAPVDLSHAMYKEYASTGNLLNPAVNPSALEAAITDSQDRVTPEFTVPAELRTGTEFWLKIYTIYTTQHVVIFDERHPEIVYEVLDFRGLAQTARNAVVYEILRERKIRSTLAAYRAAFAQLGSKKRSHRSAEAMTILAAWKGSKHKHSYRELAENLHAQTGQRDNVIRGLLKAEIYFPKMEQIFRDMSLPAQLTRLSLVESSFELSAYSSTGAQGVWQFMPATGAHYLKISETAGIDERLSPMKSSLAAAKMMRENHSRFKNWSLAITSYNHGLKGLMQFSRSKKEIPFKKVAYLFNPCAKSSPLGYAGRNYYTEFLAMVHAEAYRDLFYGIPPIPPLRALAFKKLERRQTLVSLATQNGVSVQEIRRVNPDVRAVTQVLPAGFVVAIPSDSDNLAALTHPTKRTRATSTRQAKAFSTGRRG